MKESTWGHAANGKPPDGHPALLLVTPAQPAAPPRRDWLHPYECLLCALFGAVVGLYGSTLWHGHERSAAEQDAARLRAELLDARLAADALRRDAVAGPPRVLDGDRIPPQALPVPERQPKED